MSHFRVSYHYWLLACGAGSVVLPQPMESTGRKHCSKWISISLSLSFSTPHTIPPYNKCNMLSSELGSVEGGLGSASSLSPLKEACLCWGRSRDLLMELGPVHRHKGGRMFLVLFLMHGAKHNLALYFHVCHDWDEGGQTQ